MVESLKNWLLNDVKITSGNEHEASEISKLLVKGWYFLDCNLFKYIVTTVFKFPTFHFKIHMIMHCICSL